MKTLLEIINDTQAEYASIVSVNGGDKNLDWWGVLDGSDDGLAPFLNKEMELVEVSKAHTLQGEDDDAYERLDPHAVIITVEFEV